MVWRVIATHYCCQYGDCVTATRVCYECIGKLSSHGLCPHTHLFLEGVGCVLISSMSARSLQRVELGWGCGLQCQLPVHARTLAPVSGLWSLSKTDLGTGTAGDCT
jgi:hypothetical protein